MTDIPALLTLSHGEGKRAGQIPAQRMLLGRFLMANPVSTEVAFGELRQNLRTASLQVETFEFNLSNSCVFLGLRTRGRESVYSSIE